MHAFQLVDSDFIGVYAMSNHPIVQVLIVGYVVKVDKKEKLSNYGGIISVQFNKIKLFWLFNLLCFILSPQYVKCLT